MQSRQDLLDKLLLFFRNSLYYESFIVAKEEETSASTRSLPRLEDLIAVGSGVERGRDLLEVDIID